MDTRNEHTVHYQLRYKTSTVYVWRLTMNKALNYLYPRKAGQKSDISPHDIQTGQNANHFTILARIASHLASVVRRTTQTSCLAAAHSASMLNNMSI